MADANGNERETHPPVQRREADLIWYAPAEGLSGTLILVLFLNAGLIVVLFLSQLILLAFTVLGTLILLVVFGLLSAVHLIGPGGITIQRPFGARVEPWSAFVGWRPAGPDFELVYAESVNVPPLILHPGQRSDDVVKWLDYYLDKLPEESVPADG